MLSPFLHLKPSGWYCHRFSLICPVPAVFLPRPLLLVVLPGRLRYAAHLGVGRMVGTLNLLMQSFVAIASELALPLPGNTDRCSRTLPQLTAIGYLLLPTCVRVCIQHTCGPNNGSTQIQKQICHTHVCSHKFMLTQTREDNEGTHILMLVSHKLIFSIWVQTLIGAIMKYETFYLGIQVNPFLCIRPHMSLNFKT